MFAACGSAPDEDAEAPSANDLYWFVIGQADAATMGRVYDGYFTRQQSAIERCMEAAGFEYHTSSPGAQYAIPLDRSMDREDFAQQYGLGISTMVGVGPPAPAAAADDVNGAIVNEMSAAQQSQWFAQEDQCFEEGVDVAPFYGDTARIQVLAEELVARVRTDPRVLAAESAWSQCMNASGFDFANRQEMSQTFQDQTARLVEPATSSDSTSTDDQLRELQRAELSTAEADVDCRIPRDEVEEAVFEELRTGFIELHEVELLPPSATSATNPAADAQSTSKPANIPGNQMTPPGPLGRAATFNGPATSSS